MKSSLFPLQKALIERIKTQTNWPVFDHVPKGQSCPYISMGTTYTKDWSDKFKAGQETFPTIDFWSDYEGRKEILTMVDDVMQAITSEDLDLGGGFKAVLNKLDSLNIIIDIDGITRHGILRLRFLIEEV